MKITNRVVVYGAFLAFCLLSATRDVLSEIFFKDKSYSVSPIFLLFVYCVVTQIIAGGAQLAQKTQHPPVRLADVKIELLWLNLFTLAAFGLYFFAIHSPLGAALNALVDYGSGPILTAIAGAHLMRDRLDKRFFYTAIFCISGLIVLIYPRIQAEQISLLWILGLIFALLSSLASSYYRVYFKILLGKGLSKSSIVFLRLVAATLVLGLILALQPGLFRTELLIEAAIVGAVGFALPLFLILSILQRVPIQNFAVLLFLFPAITFLLSASIGYTHFYFSDLIAGAIILAGVALFETSNQSRVA